jgi:hypothetical protein
LLSLPTPPFWPLTDPPTPLDPSPALFVSCDLFFWKNLVWQDEFLDFSHGASRDYVYDVNGIPLSFQFELTGGGAAGFDPPSSLIAPTVVEIWEAFKAIAQNA